VTGAASSGVVTGPHGPGDGERRYCLKCRTLLVPGEKRCSYCGARLRPVPYRGILWLALLGGLAVLLVVGAVQLWDEAREIGAAEAEKDANPEPRPPRSTTTTEPEAPVTTTPPTTAALVSGPVRSASVSAEAFAFPSQNSCGDPTTYEPEKADDDDLTTTWRLKGDATGQTLTFALPGPTPLTEVGVVPGYVKVDPCGDANRFVQLRRLVTVTWTFDDGSKVTQQLDPNKPAMQSMPVNVTTQQVVLTIDKVTGKAPIDFTPVSEVQFVGGTNAPTTSAELTP
jgi:hypothetical protein